MTERMNPEETNPATDLNADSAAFDVEHNIDSLLDRDGQPVQGVGRLDQVIGAEAADEFFRERHERAIYLYARAAKRWGSFSTRGHRPRRRQ